MAKYKNRTVKLNKPSRGDVTFTDTGVKKWLKILKRILQT